MVIYYDYQSDSSFMLRKKYQLHYMAIKMPSAENMLTSPTGSIIILLNLVLQDFCKIS